MKKRWLALLIVLTLCLSGCGDDYGDVDPNANIPDVSPDDMFSPEDENSAYIKTEGNVLSFAGEDVTALPVGAVYQDRTVTLQQGGTYVLEGDWTNGSVVVDAPKGDEVQLVLSGVSITSQTFAPIYVNKAKKVLITLAKETENVLKNGGAFTPLDDNNVDGVVYSRTDLTLNGEGSLTVESPGGHGVVSKDTLVVTGGSYTVSSAKSGLQARDSVRVNGGTFVLKTGSDGIHGENTEDTALGFLYFAGGEYDITSQGDGMDASNYVFIEGGIFRIEAEGKGVKAKESISLLDGQVTVTSTDDGFHSNGNVTVAGGTLSLTTQDDGIHGDKAVVISGGKVDIPTSYEGIEGLSIDMMGGEVSLVSRDDGLNAAGGNDSSGFGGMFGGGPGGDMFATTEGAYITVSAGTLSVNASGDGLDSNGDLTVKGGVTYVAGPTNSGNGALDCNGTAKIEGGILIAVGASGMAENFDSASGQGSIMVSTGTQTGGTQIVLKLGERELLSWESPKSYSSVVISCPEIAVGETYTLTAGTYTEEITMSNLIYGSGGMGGGFPGGPGGPGGGRPR